MSLANATLNTVGIVGTRFAFPFIFDPSTRTFRSNPDYNLLRNRFIRCTILILTFGSTLFQSFLALREFHRLINGQPADFTMTAMSSIPVCVYTVTLVQFFASVKYKDYIRFSLNSLLTLTPLDVPRGSGYKQTCRLVKAGFSSVGLLLFPFYLFPFSDRNEYLYRGTSWVGKALIGIAHGVPITFLIMNFIAFALILLWFLIKMCRLLETINSCKQDISKIHNFRPLFSKYLKCKSIIGSMNHSLVFCFHVVVAVGIIAASFGLFVVLTMKSKVRLQEYIAVNIFVGICFFGSLFLTRLAGLVVVISEDILSKWRRRLHRKEARKMLRAVSAIGFKLDVYGIVCSRLGLNMCEDMIDNTVTLLLL